MIMDLTVDDATVTANANIPNWTTNVTDITTDPFTQDSGPSLPENIDVSISGIFPTTDRILNRMRNIHAVSVWLH